MTSIHHLAITASNLRESEVFYDEVLPEIGFKKVLSDHEICGWETTSFELLIYAANSQLEDHKHQLYQPGFHHLALRVDSHDQVTQAATAVKSCGGRILEGPKEYPNYPGDYFAVFFLDPDGLKIEVMCL